LILRSSNIHNNQIVLKDTVHVSPEIVNTSNVNVNDIIVVVRNGSRKLIGKHARVLKAMPNTVIGAFMTGIRSQNGKFVNALFDGDIFQREIYKNLGATINQITIKSFKEMEFYIPQNHEKQIIGNLISQIDNLLALQQRKMDNLSKIQKSLENNLFPDINHVRKLKASKNNWHTKKLNNIFNERKKYDQYGQLLSVSMTKGVYPFNPSERKDNSSSNKSNYKVVRKGDIAYNSMRMWQGACGVSKYDGIVSPAYTVITPESNEDASFYYYYFKNNRMKFEFRRHSQGLTSDTWNLKFPLFKDITIEVPNNEKEQIRIRKLLDTLNEAIKHGNGRIRKLKLLKSFLLQKMFI
jgi:type I restriction enzyme S subunit